MIGVQHPVAPVHQGHAPWVRTVLGALLVFGALNAFGGGWYGLAGACGIPKEWLAGSPFADYFAPSFVLLVGVGGTLLGAAIAVLRGNRRARAFATTAGLVVLGWIAIQVAIIGFVSWMQPTTAAAGLVIVGLAGLLPPSPSAASQPGRSFASYYKGVFRRPRATFEALMADPRRLHLGALALLSNAGLYTLVYVFLVMGRGRQTAFKPWLAIDAESYYRWNVFLLAPSMALSWIVAAGIVQLLARFFEGKGTFEDTLSALGFGVAVASWWTLLHDLVTAGLGAFHVIDQRAYEDALNAPTTFRAVLWLLMGGYLAAFVVLFSKGIAAAQGVRRRHAALLGTTAFAAYQLMFVLFNR
jgi:hypothetical protein